MKQFQLSVFYQGGFLSYEITNKEAGLFQFILKSAPAGVSDAPSHFIASRKNENWTFDTELEAAFKNSVIHTLKKAKL